MKKIFTTLATALLCASASFAEIAVSYSGNNVEFGDAIELTAADFEEVIPGILFETGVEINVTSDVAPVSVDASFNFEGFQVCLADGTCFIPEEAGAGKWTVHGEISKTEGALQIHISLNGATLPEEEGEMELLLQNSLDDLYACYIKFNTKSGSVSDLGTGVKASYAGNVLSYSLNAPTKLSVYSITGATVLDSTINGNGTVDFSALPKGVYIYTLAGKASKVLVK